MQLTRRQRSILHLAVENYVRSGQPVSSGTVAKAQRGKGLSPATIRSVMKQLEAEGLLMQPHPSAGRVPTELGTRTYVDQIMSPRLHPWDRTHLQAAVDDAADDPRSGAIAVTQCLAGMSGLLAVAALPKLRSAKLQQVTLTRVAPRRLVTHLVSVDGVMHRAAVTLDVDLEPDEVARVQSILNDRLANRTLPEVRLNIAAELRHDSTRRDTMRRAALQVGMQALASASDVMPGTELVVEGTSLIAQQPEFADVGRLQDLLRAIEDKELLLGLLDGILVSDAQVSVVLGGEHHLPALNDVACVGSGSKSSFGPTVTLLGPTRMDYERLVPMVGCAAELLRKTWP